MGPLPRPVVQQTGGPSGSRGRPVSFDFGDPAAQHGYDYDRADAAYQFPESSRLSAKPEAPPASAFTAATENSRPR